MGVGVTEGENAFLSVPWFAPRDFGTDSLLVITSTAHQTAVES